MNKLNFWFSALMLLGLSVFVPAQTNRGGITGTVSDPNGAGIPGAKVTVINAGTNQATTLTTSESGSFNAAQLEPVVYQIQVEAPGFKKTLINNIKVDTSTVASVNIKLEIGQVDNTVTILADDIALNSDNGTVGQTISERQITDIPLVDRNVLALLQTLPNISGDLGSDIVLATNEDPPAVPSPGAGLSVGGGRPGQTSFLADGIQNTSAGSGRAMTTFTPDTVQELNVQTSAYSAEYGQSLGGIVNITTKSGTNNFHGTAYYFKKDPKLSAAPFTIIANPATRPVNNTNQKEYGFTIGGPIYLPSFGEGGPVIYNGKNRSFFFFAYEPRRTTDTSLQYSLFPTAKFRTGDFSDAVQIGTGSGIGYTTQSVINRFAAQGIIVPVTGTSVIYQQFVLSGNQLLRCRFPDGSATLNNPAGCPAIIGTGVNATFTPFANNIIPAAYLDPTALKLLKYLPLPNREEFIDPSGQVANWSGRRSATSSDNRYQLRLDHQISEANKISLRYSHIPIESERYVNIPLEDNSFETADQVNSLPTDLQTVDQYVLSDTHIFAPNLVNELRLGFTNGNFSRVNPPNWQDKGFAQLFGLPSITKFNLPTFIGLTAGFPIGNQRVTLLGSEIDKSFQISDTLTWIRGNQSWKMGVDLRDRRLKTEPIGNAAGGTYTFGGNATNSRGLAGGTQLGGNSIASFLLGVPGSYAYRTTVLPYYYQWGAYAAFFQNDWKVKNNLTLNLGLRYALNTPRTEKYDRQGSFLPDQAIDQTLIDAQRRTVAANIGYTLSATDPIPGEIPTATKIVPFAFSGKGGRSRYLLPIDWNGWEPRFGFAYVPKWKFFENIFGTEKMVIRGGYGLTHSSLTGLGSTPSPDFAANAAASIGYNPQTAAAQQGIGQCNLNFQLRLSNPPCISELTADQIVGTIPENGLVYPNSIFRYQPLFVVSPNTKVPRSQTWNLTASWELRKGTVLELSYNGNRGSNLFLSGRNLNAVSFESIQGIIGRGQQPNSTVNDPLGRTNASGTVQTVSRVSLLGSYLGVSNIPILFDSSGYSIRHAGSAYLRSRPVNGLNITAAYTYAKSIDVGSDAGSASVPNISASRSEGYYRYGADLKLDRAVSTFDVPHTFATTFLWDLPVGRSGYFFKNPGYIKDLLVSGWTLSGSARVTNGYPWAAILGYTNGLESANSQNVRYNINPDPSVPWLNPNYDKNCPIGTTCEPYFNPRKLILPAFGTLGSAPRTFGNQRAPWQRYADLSLQKNIYAFGKDKTKRFQLRIDALNVFNHTNRILNSTGVGSQFLAARGSGQPNYTGAISTAEYDAWVSAHPSRTRLARSVDGGATFNRVVALFNDNRVRNSAGTVLNFLPTDFYSIALPDRFATTSANSFDITNLEGYRLYRLRQVYNSNLGTLNTRNSESRRIQYSIRFYF